MSCIVKQFCGRAHYWVFSYFCFIMVSVLFLPQVSDFGLAREANFNLEGGKFPIKWTAPEAIKKGVGFVIENRETFLVLLLSNRNISLREYEALELRCRRVFPQFFHVRKLVI